MKECGNMQNKNEYLVALEKAVKYLNKMKKNATTRAEKLEISETQERLSSLYYEVKKG